MRNRKAINLIARNGKAMFGELEDLRMYGITYAAKAVILAEYGKQVWSDVLDYAIAHPQIVEFINQDPHLAASISTNSNKERWLVTDGDAAINIDYVPTHNSHIRSKYKLLAYGDLAQVGTPFGAGAAWRNNNFECLLPVNNKTTCYFAYGNTPYQFTCDVPIDTPLFIEANKNHWTWTNLQTEQVLQENVFASNITISQPNGLGIFWNNRGGAIRTNGPILAIAFVEEADGAFNLLPCLYNGIAGMVDAISGTFHPNANTQGQFTIQITDKE